MKSTGLYHYTSIDYLLKIVTPFDIDFIATYYKYYKKYNYEWIKDKGESIVQKICIVNNWKFDPAHLSYDPYIVSFCTNPDSYYMWNEFNGHGSEVMISFNLDLFLFAIGIVKLECLVPCVYINEKPSDNEIVDAVMQIMSSDFFEDIEQEDILKLAIMGVMQGQFNQEEEIRYVKLCSRYMTVYPKDEGVLSELYKVPEDKYHIHIQFPIGLINRIVLRNDVSDDDYKDVVKHMVKCGYDPKIIIKQNE